MKINIYHSLIYNFLLKTYKLRDKQGVLGKWWLMLWEHSSEIFAGAVSTTIHGFEVKVNNGNSYALYARLFPNYNNPLLQLVGSVYELYNRELTIIDIGSAVGDTNLFLIKNLPGKIEKFYCVEGDFEFFEYLEDNKKYFPKSHLFNALLSESDHSKINSLVKTHLGTASAIGEEKVKSISLDTLLFDKLDGRVDIIKIDVDGLDGIILKGTEKLLQYHKPFVIFEWHPIMIKKTQNDFHEHFEILNKCGYNRFLWFNKYGDFSHFSLNDDYLNRVELNKICLRNKHDFDFHYDVIAIHKDSNIDILKLAELKEAKTKQSSY
ncbi:FkbM family methyltransferase [Flavobacterium psychrolimnae]|uniref:FkbM family methyltransferase n=1 Tax=Flavobacterium psychrolimnae TaxID=249351 RepID=A0A366B2C2_9FLAO|nr:FkbM family methyltransferase [Flavobacterium psychrolimnae]RBN50317.1 FkbM family methyltransferase [Flavobacterium psychrolimnae]